MTTVATAPYGRYHADKPRWTPRMLAEEIGVTEARVRKLISQDRIQGVDQVHERYSFKAFPRIWRTDPRFEQPGPVLDYIEWWENHAHPVRDAQSITGRKGDS